MINKRLRAVRALLTTQECHYVLITDSLEARYLSGFEASSVVLLISQKRALVITDFRYHEVATEFCPNNPDWSYLPQKESLAQTVAHFLPPKITIAFQDNRLTVSHYSLYQTLLPQASFSPLGKEITALFMQKEPQEIAAMEEAAHIADKAYHLLFEELILPVSEITLAQKLDQITLALGSEGPAFATIVLFGKRSALPHGKPSSTCYLKEGDWVLIDFGCRVQGYCSDMTRTAVFGKASSAQRRLYQTVLSAQKIGHDQIKPGLLGHEADRLVRDSINQTGYKKEFGHGTGHGVGLRVHEVPALNSVNKTILQENMVVTIEPGIYLPDVGGVRIEDMVCLTADGIRSLSTTSRQLLEISTT